ncbi:prolyl oligopeptidase family serine peptidase [Anaerobacillus isosaccharinicus]|uniref:prolyl oligopeptidase n=1 Tax=Anaerobacillus isosaccharinicus TaxID=1532552 RepID=A0A1S2M756_9BACI|nr:prolyl oligopeptidase family serine peptidase [Anaerobacillus isosaccharinicus]MBA5586383.1 S9 family peptidase [Anaerobacillus isosaccharinicus]QOY35371.1 S9 family peptidase [Anaerobacillus isosaccharinicus]
MIKKDNIVEDFHGTLVADPYRWLEDPTSNETIEWSKEIGKQCEAYFSTTSSRDQDRERLTALWNYPKYFVPKKVEDALFYQKNDGLKNQATLYRKLGDVETVVIDPNTLSEDGTVAMTNFSISGNGQYLGYATSTHGSDWQEIKVREIATGENLADHIQDVKFTPISWSPDNSGFYYSRFPKPGTVATEDESNFNHVYFHKLGTAQVDDQLIHEQPEDKELSFSPFVTDDDQYICLHVWFGTATENRFYVKELNSSDAFIRLLDEQDAEYTYITNEGSVFYFQTDLDAPRGRVIAIDLENPKRENWKEVIAQKDDVIETVKNVDGHFIVVYKHDAHHQVHVFQDNGTYKKELQLSMIGSLTEITGKKTGSDVYFGMTSFLSPTVVYHYNIKTDELVVFSETELEVDISGFETSQVFYPSKDGTMVPMFITHQKGLQLNGENPALLYGYGGFNISLTPSFNPAILRWLEKGGIYAVANLRGGSEYGEEWHKAGMLGNKQNVFDDFIAAGEWLVEKNYTNTSKLAIMGGSNGGLLVAACMVQRPDLFGAVICRVPVIDMLRYHKFTVGRYWIPEYGNAEKAEDFPFMYAYSPLHNIQEGQKYPPLLIATAESDDRVVPAHAKKFAATLLEKADQESLVILRLEAKAGHGLGKPTSKLIDEWVDFYAFLEKELRL